MTSPTQGMRQGNDSGTQYRSAIYTTNDEQARVAQATLEAFQPVVTKARHGQITTEIKPLTNYYYAEDYHQQYLSPRKNPGGYCNHGPNGMTCPTGVAKTDA
jgi:peptide-methionine (S)-S-oxide reductase